MVFAGKKIFKNSQEELHIGNIAPKGFVECNLDEVKKALKSLGKRKFWRCHVCNDLSISITPPEICPTCFQKDAYVEINEKEIKTILEIK
jgi:rubrerythrin